MKVFNKELKRKVDVLDKACFCRVCFWPRQDPGMFVQGRGYRSRSDQESNEWICGRRNINGCPMPIPAAIGVCADGDPLHDKPDRVA